MTDLEYDIVLKLHKASRALADAKSICMTNMDNEKLYSAIKKAWDANMTAWDVISE